MEFKIVTKILNRESVFLTLFYTVLCPALGAALGAQSNLAYRHTSSTRFEHRGPNRTIQTDGTHPEERCRNSCGEKGAAQRRTKLAGEKRANSSTACVVAATPATNPAQRRSKASWQELVLSRLPSNIPCIHTP